MVESDDGVKVDDAATLVLDDLGEADPGVRGQLGGGDAREGGEGPSDRNGGAPPQLTGQRVPQDGGGIVETVGADGLADVRVVRFMHDIAGPGPAVRAAARAVRMAGPGVAAGVTGGVDRPEAGSGEGGEDGWVVVDGLGDAFASAQAGGYQLKGVGTVGGRAGRAAGGPTLPARLEQHPVGQASAGEHADQFAVVDAVATAGADETGRDGGTSPWPRLSLATLRSRPGRLPGRSPRL